VYRLLARNRQWHTTSVRERSIGLIALEWVCPRGGIVIMDDENIMRTWLRPRPRVFAEVAGVAILMGAFGHVFWAVAPAIGGGVLLALPRVGCLASPLLSLGWGWAGWEAASRRIDPHDADRRLGHRHARRS